MMKLRRIMMNRWWLVLLVAIVAGAAKPKAPSAPTPPAPPANALSGLTPNQIAAFNAGQAAFATAENPGSGLGPIYNGKSCGECHPGGSGSTRLGHIIGSGTAAQFNDGGPVIQSSAIQGFTPEAVPTDVPVGVRRSMTTQGLGLVGALTDAAILAEQTRQQNVLPSIAGAANIVTDAITGQTHVGRIGQKCQHPNAYSFSAEATLRELGLTTPFFPNEEAPYNNPSLLSGNPKAGLNDDGTKVMQWGDFMTFLAPPKSNPPTTNSSRTTVSQGATIFANLGCADCHSPSWTTGSNSINALDQKTFHPYSDFLLHDMGDSGDQIQQGTDSNGQPIPGSWMRTTPLWGVRLNATLWHDGSIKQGDYAGCINKHLGQGLAAKAAYQSLSSSQKQALVAFLNSL
jgi:CxxC motif-containing protein (DUF1111 family)